MDAATWTVVRLTAQLAGLSTLLLLLLGTPLAWWLARTRSPAKPVLASLVAMPLVLPPSVIGFYLLLLMGPQGPVGQFTQWLGLGRLPFTFSGLVVASVVYSMPFVVQPLQQAFEAIAKAHHFPTQFRGGSHDPVNHRVQSGAVAAAREDSNAHASILPCP
jgi:molybdate transport system permease protein